MNDDWKLFTEELPTDVPGEQVDILFGHPDWATYFRGMYTHFPDDDLRERLSEYKPDIDKFWAWESMVPTHWMKLPNNPTHREDNVIGIANFDTQLEVIKDWTSPYSSNMRGNHAPAYYWATKLNKDTHEFLRDFNEGKLSDWFIIYNDTN